MACSPKVVRSGTKMRVYLRKIEVSEEMDEATAMYEDEECLTCIGYIFNKPAHRLGIATVRNKKHKLIGDFRLLVDTGRKFV